MSDRWYDAKRGCRFDKLHPLWPVTKAGTPRKIAPPWETMLALDIEPVPSVTTVSRICNGDGFSAGARWVMSLMPDIIGSVLTSVDTSDTDATTAAIVSAVMAETEEATVSQRNKGTHYHDVVDSFFTDGVVPIDTDDAVALALARKAVDAAVKGPFECVTEIQFANSQYGGTVDFGATDEGGQKYVLDWKFTSSQRKPKASEIAQIAGYCEHYSAIGGLVIMHVPSQAVSLTMLYPCTPLYDAGKDAFTSALDMFWKSHSLSRAISARMKQNKKQ